jgi:microcystin-dependent protein
MKKIFLPCVSFALLAAAQPAAAGGTSPHIGERMVIYGNSGCPRGWVAVNGQGISNSQTVLSGLIAGIYGPNGAGAFQSPAEKPLFERAADGSQVLVTQCIAVAGATPTF